MVPLELFRSRTFSGANLLTLLLYAALAGAFLFIPFNMIQVHGYSPAAAGAAMIPVIALLSLLSSRAGRLADRYGVRRSLMIGPFIAGVGFALLAFPKTGGSYWTTFFPGMLVLGLGMSGTVAPLTTSVMTCFGPERSGVASGINNAVSRIASVLAIPVFGLVAYNRFGSSLATRLDAVRPSAAIRYVLLNQRGKLAGMKIPASVSQPLRGKLEQVVDQSFVDAFASVMLLAAALALTSAAVAWALIEPKGMSSSSEGSSAK
jgi:predicted MFS family arabinose efflux permease